jgi:hypothetical protein
MTVNYIEYGLQLPNGDIHWGQYLNRPIRTEAERGQMAVVLHRTALECGFDEEEFVSRYNWVSRGITTNPRTWEIDDPEVAPSPGQPQPEPSPPVEKKAPAKRARPKRVPMNTASK